MQALAADAPSLLLYFAMGQFEQVLFECASVTVLCFPCAHIIQLVWSSLEYLPAGQIVHVFALASANFPFEHGEHTGGEAVAFKYVPASHGPQYELPFWEVPD